MRKLPGTKTKTRLRSSVATRAGAGALAWLLLAGFDQPPPQSPAPPTRDTLRGTVGTPDAGGERRPGRLTVEGGLERGPCALDRPEYGSIRFTLTDVDFADLKGLTPTDLRPAWAEYVGTEQPLSVLCEIRDRAAAMLREAGYIAAVEVPEQRIEGGHVHFRVLMAKLVALHVRGEAGRNERLIAAYLNHLTGQEVFNRYQAERYLLLAGDLPGTAVRLALRPAGTVPGEVVGEVTVVRLPGQFDLNVQNLGSEAVGDGGFLARAQIYGLTGLGDRTILAAYTTADFREQQTVQLAHDFTVGGQGLRLGGQVTYSWSRPTTGLAGFDIKSQTLFATLDANYPLIRTQAYTLRAGAGLDIIDQDVSFNGVALSQDRLRVAFARLDFEAAENVSRTLGLPRVPRWRAAGGIELRQGIQGLGASAGCGVNLVNCFLPGVVPPSQLEGDAGATVLRANLAGEWRPVPWLGFYGNAMAQYTDRPLLSFEEFSAGNYTIGRGYDPAIITGDRGAGVQAELRFGRAAPRGPNELVIQPYLFFDAAWIRQRDQFVATQRDDIQSVGGGVRARLGDRANLDLSLAIPLVRTFLMTEKPDPRVLVTITTRLLPWSTR